MVYLDKDKLELQIFGNNRIVFTFQQKCDKIYNSKKSDNGKTLVSTTKANLLKSRDAKL